MTSTLTLPEPTTASDVVLDGALFALASVLPYVNGEKPPLNPRALMLLIATDALTDALAAHANTVTSRRHIMNAFADLRLLQNGVQVDPTHLTRAYETLLRLRTA